MRLGRCLLHQSVRRCPAGVFIGQMDQTYKGAVSTVIAMSADDSAAGFAGVSIPLTGWPQTGVETKWGPMMVTKVQCIRSRVTVEYEGVDFARRQSIASSFVLCTEDVFLVM